jgi:hypothetical protein
MTDSALPVTVERINIVAACAATGLKRHQLRNQANRGQVPGAAKMFGTWTFNVEKLDAWKSSPPAEPRPPRLKRPKRTAKNSHCLIYFISCGPFIKIGRTHDVPRRLATLQVGSPYPLKLLIEMDGGERVEKELHARYAAYRVGGEWFERRGALASFLRHR